MKVVICPGVHPPTLTDSFLQALAAEMSLSAAEVTQNFLVYPAHRQPAFSGWHILRFIREQIAIDVESLLFIGFSAGVVGALSATWMWQDQGGRVRALIALDGWGVPLWGNFPIHRISHDYFTHWSSICLGSHGDHFYADPAVDHLDLWRLPQYAAGWHTQPELLPWKQPSDPDLTAVRFLAMLLKQYGKTSDTPEVS